MARVPLARPSAMRLHSMDDYPNTPLPLCDCAGQRVNGRLSEARLIHAYTALAAPTVTNDRLPLNLPAIAMSATENAQQTKCCRVYCNSNEKSRRRRIKLGYGQARI